MTITAHITPTGWLVAGPHRINLATVERYEQRDSKVLLHGAQWSVAISCDPDPMFMEKASQEGKAGTPETIAAKETQLVEATATATELVAALDAHFTPPTP